MKQARAIGRKDANHNDLVKHARSLGMTWQDTCQIPGALDGIVGYMGVDQRVEIKNPKQPKSSQALTDAEIDAIEGWRGRTVIIWRTVEDVEKTRQRIYEEVPF